MDTKIYVEKYINHLNNLNEENIKNYKYDLKEDLPEKKPTEIKSYKEMKNFTDSRKKFYEKNTNLEKEQIFNIFENNSIKTDEKQINFYDLDYDNKISHITDYMKRKKIKLDVDLDSIKEIIDNNDLLKKYISIDKTYNMISKISFFKKMEDGNYTIKLDINNKRTKKNFFMKK